MSDFLSDLVTRALRLEPLVKPVVPSLFDPGAAAQAWAETEEVDEPARVSPPDVFQDGAAARFTRPAPEPAGHTIETRELRTAPERQEPPAPPRLAGPPPRTPQPEPAQIGTETTLARETIERSERISREIHTLEIEEREVRHAIVQPRTELVVKPDAPRPVAAPRHAPEAALVRERPERPVWRQTEPPPLEATPPTVQVSIGRVEVRAVFPPAPAKQAVPRTNPAVPLEEYLNRRSGRRRP